MKLSLSSRLILWTGPKHSGKTTTLTSLIYLARLKGIAVAGILAPSVYIDDKLAGFDIVDLDTNQRTTLSRRGAQGSQTVGQFVFTDQGLELGRSALQSVLISKTELIVIDEYGPLELAHRGWRTQVDRLIAETAGIVLLVVRDELAQQVSQLYPQPPALFVPAAEPDSIDRVLDLSFRT